MKPTFEVSIGAGTNAPPLEVLPTNNRPDLYWEGDRDRGNSRNMASFAISAVVGLNKPKGEAPKVVVPEAAYAEPEPQPTSQEVFGDSDIVWYKQFLRKSQLLTAVEEVELSKAIEAGLYAEKLLSEAHIPEGVTEDELQAAMEEGRQARDRFFESNLRLAFFIAQRYHSRAKKMSLMELVSEANDGLVEAVWRFDYTRGYKFSTHATWWIRKKVLIALQEKDATIRLSRDTFEDITRLRTIRGELWAVSGEHPSDEDLATALGISMARLHELYIYVDDVISLSTPVGIELYAEEMVSQLVVDEPSVEDTVLNSLEREDIGRVLASLSDLESDILCRHVGYGRPKQTLKEIADTSDPKVSYEKVRRIYQYAKAKFVSLWNREQQPSPSGSLTYMVEPELAGHIEAVSATIPEARAIIETALEAIRVAWANQLRDYFGLNASWLPQSKNQADTFFIPQRLAKPYDAFVKALKAVLDNDFEELRQHKDSYGAPQTPVAFMIAHDLPINSKESPRARRERLLHWATQAGLTAQERDIVATTYQRRDSTVSQAQLARIAGMSSETFSARLRRAQGKIAQVAKMQVL